MLKNTIESVVNDELCTGCGTCVGICPLSAIEMVKNNSKGIYLPQLDDEKCNQCGICLDACPGHSVNFQQLNLDIFGQEPQDILLGNYLNCYIGHATDYEIRYNSASGGLVTALLIFALDEGLINGALVTKMSEQNPLEPQPFIARTKEQIISAAKSKYCPVPANIALKEILKEEGKFAVVGLPCHIQGVRKAELVNKKLREKIVFHFGLFCSYTPSFLGTESLLKQLKTKKEEVTNLDYRGEGWPGGVSIQLKSGRQLFLPHGEVWGAKIGFGLFFWPKRCALCCDATSELADISFGDAWLPELSEEKIGESLLLCRTEVGKHLIQTAEAKRRLELSQTDAKVPTASGTFYIKKRSLNARIKLFHRNIPRSDNALNPNIMDYIFAPYFHFNFSRVSRNRFFRKLMEHTPTRIKWFYRLPYVVVPIIRMAGFKELFRGLSRRIKQV